MKSIRSLNHMEWAVIAVLIIGIAMFSSGSWLMENSEAPEYVSVYIQGEHFTEARRGGSVGWDVGNFMCLFGMVFIITSTVFGSYCIGKRIMKGGK